MNIHLKPEERLSVLRVEDEFRRWGSLDDERLCILCETKFNGRQVEIRRFANGKHELHCPTEACNSRPHQWVYPGTPLVSDIVDPDWGARKEKAGTAIKRADWIPKIKTAVIETLDRAGAPVRTDEALMKDVSRRRHGALRALYGRYSQRLRAMIDSVVHEETETDDVLQESLLQIWNEADHYSPKAGKPLGWMVTIARRRAIDRLRRRQAYSRARERYGQALLQRPRNPRREAYDPFILNDLRSFLKKSMRALPPLQREALELAFFKGLSHSEIAAATNAPLGTVKTRLELGLRKLTYALRPFYHKV
jgi:RNA polymerase sigma-70 factor, ECF subfamily